VKARTASDPLSRYIPLVFLALYAMAVIFRPLLPVDETRYLTAAWEMLLRHDWFAPLTVNFEPYHQKPPMLFWLINLSWSVFGASRWAAMIPIVLASMASVYLTSALCRRLQPPLATRAWLVLLGMFGFLLYSTAILFDMTLTVFVIGALLAMLAYARERRVRYVLLLGVLLGLGVLTKGPVAWLYVLFPILLGPYWIDGNRNWKSWYLGALGAFMVSLIPVLAWLVPVLKASSSEFGYWLVWEQTAGRITGSYQSSHDRPFYFFLIVLPLLSLPWIFFPRLWQRFGDLKRHYGGNSGLRFLLLWIVPTFVAFSLIGGKQPHYMIPLLPGVAILTAYLLRELSARTLQITTAAMLIVIIGGHAAMSNTIRHLYDLGPIAAYVAAHKDRDWAYVGNYHGEVNYLARLKKPFEELRPDELDAWFDEHPGGLAITRYMRVEELARYDILLSMRYRGRELAVIAEQGSPSTP
jgi:4-amino-4-deoxy-L-arabinose transferase-like glycosyltransferase